MNLQQPLSSIHFFFVNPKTYRDAIYGLHNLQAYEIYNDKSGFKDSDYKSLTFHMADSNHLGIEKHRHSIHTKLLNFYI